MIGISMTSQSTLVERHFIISLVHTDFLICQMKMQKNQPKFMKTLISPSANDSFRSRLIFSADFFLFTKFCTVIRCKPNCITLLLNFGNPPPKKNLRAKNLQNFGKFSILEHFKIWRRVSSVRIKIFKIGELHHRPRLLPRSAKKSGKLWFTNYGDLKVKSNLPKLTFSEDHILGPKGCCAPDFYTR